MSFVVELGQFINTLYLERFIKALTVCHRAANFDFISPWVFWGHEWVIARRHHRNLRIIPCTKQLSQKAILDFLGGAAPFTTLTRFAISEEKNPTMNAPASPPTDLNSARRSIPARRSERSIESTKSPGLFPKLCSTIDFGMIARPSFVTRIRRFSAIASVSPGLCLGRARAGPIAPFPFPVRQTGRADLPHP